jgi:hypothetical protein
MKKKILFSVFVLCIGYLLINLYAYYKLKDCCILSQSTPGLPMKNGKIDREYVLASYVNSSQDSILFCKYPWTYRYKYIFYEPQTLSNNFTVYFSKALSPKSVLIAQWSSKNDTVGNCYTDFLTIDSIPPKLLIQDGYAIQSYKLKTTYLNIKSNIAWYEKLRWGPITDFVKM